MTVMAVMPRDTEWTVYDLDGIVEDSLQYELLDGLLLVTPAPSPDHQRAVQEIFKLLDAQCPDDLEVFVAPLDWRPDIRTSLQPDVLVARRDDVGVKDIQRPLQLAVEVLSPSTQRKDLVFKFSKYADAGIPSYWVIDPQRPEFIAYELVEGSYVETARAVGDEVAHPQYPFPVQVVPERLTRR